jgi:ATP synthase protein I
VKLVPQAKQKSRAALFRAMSFSSQIGFTIVFCILIGVLLGNYLDGLIGSSPLLLLLFSLLGMAAAFRVMFGLAKKKQAEDNR